MRSDDFATARYEPPYQEYPSGAEPYEGEAAFVPPPNPANYFTPISAADRLRDKPKHRESNRCAVMPPLAPGQRYGYGPAYEENETENAHPEGLREYRQAYWEHLREVAGTPAPQTYEEPPAYGAASASPFPAGLHPPRGDVYDDVFGGPSGFGQDAFAQDSFGYGQEDDGQEGAYATTPYPPYDLSGYGYQEEPLFLEESGGAEDLMGASMAYEPPYDFAQETSYGFPYEGAVEEAYPQRYEPIYEISPDLAGERRSDPAPFGPEPMAAREPSQRLLARLKQRMAQAFWTEHDAAKPRMKLGRVAAICIIVVMLAFCGVEMGKIVLGMMQNEEEMKAVREEYYQKAGVELVHDAMRVELLPPGVTFTPTVTPEQMPQAQATPTPREPALQGGAAGGAEAAGGEAAPAPPERTKATRYADNPLKNIREEFAQLYKENPDTIGRLVIEGMVDEVVVQRNNTYYLTHNARGSFGEAGAVFVDEAYSIKTPPENLLLRGQATAEGKLLYPLLGYQQGGVEYVKRGAILRLDTLFEEGQYVVFAVIAASGDPASPQYFNYAGYPTFQSDEQMARYVAAAKQHSLYQIPVEVQPSDRLLTLSTLGNGSEKECLVIMARKLRGGETPQSLNKAISGIRAY